MLSKVSIKVYVRAVFLSPPPFYLPFARYAHTMSRLVGTAAQTAHGSIAPPAEDSRGSKPVLDPSAQSFVSCSSSGSQGSSPERLRSPERSVLVEGAHRSTHRFQGNMPSPPSSLLSERLADARDIANDYPDARAGGEAGEGSEQQVGGSPQVRAGGRLRVCTAAAAAAAAAGLTSSTAQQRADE